MSGMSVAEATRQLEGAIRYMRKPRQVVLDAAFTPHWQTPNHADDSSNGNGTNS
jgi:hypothetical protein